jgi:phytoene dehydrogenase-like protein
MMSIPEDLPVAVVGAGPVGLAAAAHLMTRGLPVKVYEAGETIGANVRNWGHVRLFSPWGYNIDPAAKGLLMRHGWREPCADTFPTGGVRSVPRVIQMMDVPGSSAKSRSTLAAE